jgi:predicted transposase/invertase (TIGR01784 family)
LEKKTPKSSALLNIYRSILTVSKFRQISRFVKITAICKLFTNNLSAICLVMGGLSLEKKLIEPIFQSELMKESAIYQEWRQENLAEGRGEERLAIARKMLQEGMDPEIIAKITELSIAQIQKLQKQP